MNYSIDNPAPTFNPQRYQQGDYANLPHVHCYRTYQLRVPAIVKQENVEEFIKQFITHDLWPCQVAFYGKPKSVSDHLYQQVIEVQLINTKEQQ